MAATAAVLFVLSILAHELSHALVGRANGVAVAGITLFIFGGVAHMRGEPRSPRAELLMTVVGPLTSLAIGLLATAGGAYLATPAVVDAADPFRAFQRVGPFATVLLWLGPINIMIGLFNLIPGIRWTAAASCAPRFGRRRAISPRRRAGRVRRPGVRHVPDYPRRQHGVGRRDSLAGPGPISGLWMAFIGWFLYGAAAASTSQVMLSERLEGVPVSRLMKHQSATIDADLRVARLVDDYFMSTSRAGVSGRAMADRLLGIVTMEDIRKVSRDEWPTTRVRDVMTAASGLAVATPDESAAAALTRAGEPRLEQLPVVDGDGRLVGHASPPRHPALAGASTAPGQHPRPRTTRLSSFSLSRLRGGSGERASRLGSRPCRRGRERAALEGEGGEGAAWIGPWGEGRGEGKRVASVRRRRPASTSSLSCRAHGIACRRAYGIGSPEISLMP